MDDQIREAPPGRLFLSGATGFLGRRALERACERREVTALRHPPELPPRYAALPCRWIDGSLESVSLSGCSAVIHMAALESGPSDRIYEVNVGGTEALLRAARRDGVERFLHVSSLDAALGRRGAYGESKQQAESLVRGSGLDWMIVRPSVLYGAGGGALLCKLIRRAALGRPVPLLGDGRQLIQPLCADDLARLLVEVVEEPLGERVFELGGPEACSYQDALQLAAGLTGSRARLIPLPVKLLAPALVALEQLWEAAPLTWSKVQAATRPKVVDLDAARDQLGFSPRPLRDGLRDMLQEEGLL